MTAEQLDAAIASLVAQLAEGTQSIRFQDGSSVQYIDASQAEARLRLLRNERARLADVTAAPARIRFHQIGVRRAW